jgi:hypothetical protein
MRIPKGLADGHAAADGAEPDEAQGPALELGEEPARPLTGAHVAIHGGDATSHRQHEGDGVLGQRVGVDARSVGDGDAARLACGQVHVVRARAPDRDVTQLGAGGEHAVGEARVGANVEDRVGVADRSIRVAS